VCANGHSATTCRQLAEAPVNPPAVYVSIWRTTAEGRVTSTIRGVTDRQVGEPVVFFSYAQVDDEHTGGAASALRADLESALRVVMGRKVTIFQDRESIAWGQAWEERIATTLAGAKALVTLVSPSFFASYHCRDEVEAFLGVERLLGRTDLVLPLLWVNRPIERLPVETRDMARLLATRQQVDWSQLRFEDRRSGGMRRAIHLLAERLADVLWAEEVETALNAAPALPREAALEPTAGATNRIGISRREPTSPNWIVPVYVAVDVSPSTDESTMKALNDVMPHIVDELSEIPVLSHRYCIGLIDFADDARVAVPLCDVLKASLPTLEARGRGVSWSAAFRTLRASIEQDVGLLQADRYAVHRPFVMFFSAERPADRTWWRAYRQLAGSASAPYVIPLGMGAQRCLSPIYHPAVGHWILPSGSSLPLDIITSIVADGPDLLPSDNEPTEAVAQP
jgi:uncharacterized protein YegL